MGLRPDTFFLVAGDVLPRLECTLETEDGAPIAMPDAQRVELHVRATGAASGFLVASCAFSTATSGASVGHVTCAWGSTRVPTAPGLYQAQFMVEWAGSQQLRVPNPGFLAIKVSPNIA